MYPGTKLKREDIPEAMGGARAAAYSDYRKDPANSGNEGETVDDATGSNVGAVENQTPRVALTELAG